ncbi:hypothetical protein ACSVC9_12060 [Clostridium sp. LBM24168]
MENNNIYIMSVEGAEIWEYINRRSKSQEQLNGSYCGMIPYSLELRHLQKQRGFKTFRSKRYNKIMTNDIINIKFNQKVKSGNEVISIIKKKINNIVDTEENKKYIEKLKKYIDEITNEIQEDKWKEIKNDKLRTLLYKEGFTLTFHYKDENSKQKTEKVDFVVYKRSAAKSRTGQVLFIKKSLRNSMINWARMGMRLEERDDIDFPGLLSYESLVSSHIEDIIKIDTKNILIVNDVKSVFLRDCNVVKKEQKKNSENNKEEKSEKLFSKRENIKMENDLFDGEGILDSSYFKSGKGMMLLRNHMFKSCVFNCNLQKFLKENCPEDVDYDDWQLEDMFNEPIFAKDICMIITPNSLKALKFYVVKGNNKKKMWLHWKKKIQDDDCIFGICKSEQESTKGKDDDGNVINQMSYQMLNSIPINYYDMAKLSEFELNYIDKLKNDIETYIQYLKHTANAVNSNNMLVDLYNRNNKIANTKIFKDKRKKDIHNYITHMKKGKIRLNGDYCTIAGNLIEYLYNSIDKLPVDKNNMIIEDEWIHDQQLKENEVYTTVHPFNEEYVAFRNPHTSPSNVLIVNNKDNEFIRKYFNLTNNIIVVNAIKFPIQRILSGCDYDSDTLLLINNSCLLSNAKKCYDSEEYRVCQNSVGLVNASYIKKNNKNKNRYKVCIEDMAKIDNILAASQKNIGTVVNLGQLYMSTYWNLINKNSDDKDKKEKLLQGVDICTVLSEICIDSAKRMYDVDIDKQVKNLKDTDILHDKKPLFFKYISKNKIMQYDTSMDYLQNIMSISDADQIQSIQLDTLLLDIDRKKAKKKQIESIISCIMKMTNKQKSIETKYEKYNKLSKSQELEKYNKLDDNKSDGMRKIKRYKIRVETVHAIIYKIFHREPNFNPIKCKYKLGLLNALYRADKGIFLQVFKTK